jgi:hypothetical protein
MIFYCEETCTKCLAYVACYSEQQDAGYDPAELAIASDDLKSVDRCCRHSAVTSGGVEGWKKSVWEARRDYHKWARQRLGEN